MPSIPANAFHLVDAVGTHHGVAGETARIVSLVPSITELLFDLGLEGQIVGRTGFCIHPRDKVKRVPKVGGTKSIEAARVKRLTPTHLIVNIDENPRAAVEELARFVPHVVVTHPRGPLDNLALYRLLGGIFEREAEAERLCHRFERSLTQATAAAAGWPRQSVLYLIWKAPWMTVSRDTYISRMLAVVGWETWEPKSEARYPAIGLTPDLLQQVDLVLLSSEPYSFGPRHQAELLDALPLASRTRVALIDGSMTSWYGSRAIEGVEYLSRFRDRLG